MSTASGWAGAGGGGAPGGGGATGGGAPAAGGGGGWAPGSGGGAAAAGGAGASTACWWPVGSQRRYSPQLGQKSGSFSAICPQLRQTVLTRPPAAAPIGSGAGTGRAPAS